MEIYKRNISSRLFIFRLLFTALLILSICLFYNERKEYSYLIIVALLLCSIFPIFDLKIYYDKLEVKQFFIFGIIPRKIIFEKRQTISFMSFDIELNDPATWADMESLDINPVFLKMFIIKQEDEIGNVKKVKLRLSEKEFELIQSWASK